jgi:hypothetical protein
MSKGNIVFIQRSPNRWSCLPAAAAMVMDVPLVDVLNMIGHDGSDIYWPSYPEPYRRRAFHIQEIIEIGLRLQWAFTPIEPKPFSWPPINGERTAIAQPACTQWDSQERLLTHLFNRRAILLGIGPHGGHHAVACDNQRVFDPNGLEYQLSTFKIREAWLATPIQSISD